MPPTSVTKWILVHSTCMCVDRIILKFVSLLKIYKIRINCNSHVDQIKMETHKIFFIGYMASNPLDATNASKRFSFLSLFIERKGKKECFEASVASSESQPISHRECAYFAKSYNTTFIKAVCVIVQSF